MGLDVDAINDLHFRFSAHCGLLNLFASSSPEQGGLANARVRFHALGLLLVHADKLSTAKIKAAKNDGLIQDRF